jgi:hypothetical protein
LNDTKEIKNPGQATRFYEGQVPPFTESTLETLYSSLYSSLPQLSLGDLDHVSTYAAKDKGYWRALFLYVRQRREIRVINEGMTVMASDAERFAQQIFSRDTRVSKVRFHAISWTGSTATIPTLHLPVTEDIVIDLPDDEGTYIASLGKSTRKTLRQNQSRARVFSYQIFPGAEADVSLIDKIIGFNHARMAGKQRVSALDARSSAQLLNLLRARGMVGAAFIDGLLCAGTLACRFGDDVFSLVNAHDPAVDHLGMGNISRHLMILEAIRLGARRFHLLGGYFASKRSCGARRLSLDDVTLYRNRLAIVADITGILEMILQSAKYKISVTVEEQNRAGPTNRTLRFAVRCMRLLREAIQTARALTTARH